jgi:tryptophan synthase alpha chain
MISSLGKGFVYTVTVKGITGTRKGYDDELHQFLKAVKDASPIPVLAGFGISSEAQIRELTELCDGVIVGSKIVEFFENNKLDEMEKFMSVFNQETKTI